MPARNHLCFKVFLDEEFTDGVGNTPVLQPVSVMKPRAYENKAGIIQNSLGVIGRERVTNRVLA